MAQKTPPGGAGIRLVMPDAGGWHRFPDIDDLASRLRFSPSEGYVWLSNCRMILLHNSSLASLRRELIETLGRETARGLLTRMGYHAGTKDAEMIRNVRPDRGFFDTFAVGPQLHGLEGWVSVETQQVEFDVEKGEFFGDFIWRNSAEAEEHIAAYGLGNEPVCWMQQGYANGYVSGFMGRQILVREVECRAMGHSACRIIAKPPQEWENAGETFKYLRAQNFVQSASRPSILTPRSTTGEVPDPINLVGVSAGFNAVCHMINRVAPTRATVLFLGESGVGKEQFARTLHQISDRAKQPFVAVNCAAIPEQLIESELFGVEKGGYSGATQSRPGRFERADGGTLFLDEIGTLSLFAQGKLLRALQEGEIERIGDTRTRKVNVRVIAATNEELRTLVDEGKFREDLYFRLNVFPVQIPPLRSRREDIPLLLEYFLKRYSALHHRTPTGFTAQALEALLAYDWPGNIRELENVVERGVILAPDGGAIDIAQLFTSGERIHAKQFKINAEGTLGTAEGGEEDGTPLRREDVAQVLRRAVNDRVLSLDDMEAMLVNTAHDLAGGNVSAAAKLLGTTRARAAYRIGRKKKGE